MPSFLAERALNLSPEGHEGLLDCVEQELPAALARLRRRSTGDYGPDGRLEKFPKAALARPQKVAGMTAWQLFEAWITERQPAPATVNRWRGVFEAMNVYFEHRDVSTFTKEDAIKWKDTLVTADRRGDTVNDVWLNAARTIFNYALENQKIASNPFVRVRVAVGKKVTPRREFNAAEIATILSATFDAPPKKMQRHNADARRWVPWICGYTGSRPGEITQLRSADVYQHGGSWVMRITPDAGTVKDGVERIVPLHEHLVEQGFVEFAKSHKGALFYVPGAQRKKGPVDPTNPPRGGWTKTRAKLAEWVRSLGCVEESVRPNHAWRHTFRRRARRAGLELSFRDGMCGHTPAVVGDRYDTATLEDLIEGLKSFPRYTVSGADVGISGVVAAD